MLLKLFSTPPNLDLYRLGNDYLRTFEPVWSGKTRDCKYRDLWLFCTFLQSRGLVATLKDLTRENVIAFISWRLSAEESPASIARRFSTLSHFCRYLRETRKDFHLSLAGIPLPALPSNRPQGLTEVELSALRELARKDATRGDFESLRNCVLLETFLATGMRIAEVTNLRAEQISADFAWFRGVAVKGGRTRNVLILPCARELLRGYLAIRAEVLAAECSGVNLGASALFCALRGPEHRTFLNIKTVYRIIVSLGERAGVDIHPHQLRHTVAHTLLAGTNNIRAVAQQLGHLSLQTTMKYTEQTDRELREAIEYAARTNNSRGDS